MVSADCRTTGASPLEASLGSGVPWAMLELLDQLRATMFCVKGRDGRYLAVNPTFVQRTLRRSQREVLGARADELFVPELAARYQEQDERVFATGEPLLRELELIRAVGGPYRWHLTSKVPIFQESEMTGLVSISEMVGDTAREHDPDDPQMREMAVVLATIERRIAEPLRVPDLASAVHVSEDTLARRVERTFGRSPAQLILSVRIDRARTLLATGQQSIADIAHATGFYDQAAFTRTFARLVGRTPGQYRRQAT
ncbi:MAG: helix-turn-helix domain-containing protein [Actinomycetales bacterium]